ncbi:MAG: sulfatase-like hydrolase/transferase [Caldilineaceae bacterium]
MADGVEPLPYSLQGKQAVGHKLNEIQIRQARRAFYALCTHIDHQLRVVIGTLREEGLLNDTIILFTSDHGDMLGNHGMWAKRLFYEYSANVPMILLGTAGDARVGHHRVDDRLVGWQDIMPTLLDLAGVPIPQTVEGMSMVGEQQRDWFYGEIDEGAHATRMIRDGRYKLIYYAAGNHRQLFDLQEDPNESLDCAQDPAYAEPLERLTQVLITQLYGGDEAWVQDGTLVGLPDRPFVPGPNRGLTSQRGAHWPQLLATNMPQIEWHGESGGNR